VPPAIRELFEYIPQNNLEIRRSARPTTRRPRDEELLDIVPDNPNKPYDMHDVIRRVVDDGEFYEVHADYAGNILCGFAHLGGTPSGSSPTSRRCSPACSTSTPR
jgi:propionyl-CoA carboxylase beta chain